MTTSRSFFTPVLGGGHGDTGDHDSMGFDEVRSWSVSLLFRLPEDSPAPGADDRYRMLVALSGLSPLLTVRGNTLALTVAALGTQDRAVTSGLEAAWSAFEAGAVDDAELVGVELISHEAVDACVETGLPFIYDSGTRRAQPHQDALRELRALKSAEEVVDGMPRQRASRIAPDCEVRITSGVYQAEPAPLAPSVGVGATCDVFRPSLFPNLVPALTSLYEQPERRDGLRFMQAVMTLISANIFAGEWLVNQKAAAGILNVTKQRAHQLLRGEGAPTPVACVDGKPLWLRPQIEELREQRAGS